MVINGNGAGNSAISGNDTAGNGGGIGVIAPNTTLAMTGGTLSNNAAKNNGGGLYVTNSGAANLQIVTITGNTANSDNVGGGDGGAVFRDVGAGTVVVNFSRITGNLAKTGGGGTGTAGIRNAATGIVDAKHNWWGAEANPGSAGTDGVSNAGGAGAVTTSPRLHLGLTNTPSPNPNNPPANTVEVNHSSVLTADFTTESDGATTVTPANLATLIGLPITFVATGGTIAEPQPETIQSNGKATATYNAGNNTGVFSATAKVDNNPPASTNITVVALADMEVASNVDSPDPVIAGNNITYTITIHNNGPDDAHGVSVTDLVPTGTTFVSATAVGGSNPDGFTYLQAAGTVTGTPTGGIFLAGSTDVFTLVVHVLSSAVNGSPINDTASIGTSDVNTIDGTSGNNSKQATTTVITRADLSISKGGPTDATAGDPLGYDYTLTVHNGGPSDLTGGFTITDVLPTGTTFSSVGSTGGGSFDAGTNTVTYTVNSGMNAASDFPAFTIHVKVGASVPDGTVLKNTVSVASNGTTDPDNTNNTSNEVDTTVHASADLSITKSGPSTATAGDPNGFDYVVSVLNNGPSDNAGGFKVTDVLPTGTIFDAVHSTAGASFDAPTNTVTYTIGTGLASTTNASFTIHVTVDPSVSSGTVLRNTATVATAGTTDPVSNNNTSLAFQTRVSAVDLTLTKTDDVSHATTLGNSWTWKLHVANAGNGAATFTDGQKIVLDNLPTTNITYGNTVTFANQTNLSGTGTLSGTIDGSGNLIVTASGGTVIIGDSGSFDVSITATPGAIGTFDNPVSGGSAKVDPDNDIAESNENNNTATTDSVTVTAPDLTLTKSNNVNGTTTPGTPWTWKLHVANTGNAPAKFTDGQQIVRDNLPHDKIGYTDLTISNINGVQFLGGVFNDAIDANANDTLTVTCIGGLLQMDAGASFDVTFTAVPLAVQTYDNPVSGGTAKVDPDNHVTESNENNNTGSDSVKVTGADLSAIKSNNVSGSTILGPSDGWTWKIHVQNTGVSDATFATGNTILTDNLPDTNISYGSVTFANITNVTDDGNNLSGTIDGSKNLRVFVGANKGGDPVIIKAGGSFDVTFTATPTAAGTYANPRSGGSAKVDPDNLIAETDETNNDFSNSVEVKAPDLRILNGDGRRSVIPGDSTSYTITVSNGGNVDVTGAKVADTFDFTKFSSVDWTASASGGATGFSFSGSGNINDTVNFPVGSSVIYVVNANVQSSATGTLSNTATVTAPSGVTESDTTNNSATDDDTLTPQADLSVTKSDDVGGNSVGSVVGTAIPGNVIHYTITVSNTGPGDAPGSVVKDTFDSNLTNISYSVTQLNGATGAFAGIGNLNQTVSLPAGSIIIYTVTATIKSSATGTLSNTATVTASGSVTDTNSANDSATDSDNLTPKVDLKITKKDDLGGNSVGSVVGTAIPGNVIHYTITVSNTGPSDAPNSKVADTFLASQFSSASYTAQLTSGTATGFTTSGNGNINDTAVSLAAGSSVTYTVTATIKSSATGTLSNTATVTADSSVTDTNGANNSATDTDNLTPKVDLKITKSDDLGGNSVGPVQGTAIPGNVIHYTITVSNSGPSDAPNSVVADTFASSQFKDVSWTVQQNGVATGATADSGNINQTVNLPSGSSIVYTVTATIKSSLTEIGSTLSNTATVTAAATITDTNGTNNSALDKDTLTPKADLSIGKIGPDSATAGDPAGFDYVLTVTNNGPTDNAGGFKVTDVLPTGTIFDAAHSTAGASATGQTITYNTSTGLVSGDLAKFTIHVKVASSVAAGTVLPNSATVATNGTTDPNSSNNTSGTINTTIARKVDLTVTKTGPESVVAGSGTDNVVYVITVKNNGPSNSAAVAINEATTIPGTGVTIHSLVASAGSFTPSGNAATGTWTIGALASGASATLTVKITVGASAVAGLIVIRDTASVKSIGANETLTNDSDDSATVKTSVTRQADLAVTKTGPSNVLPGATATYVITVKNNGPSDASGIKLTDTSVLPTGVTLFSSNTATGSFSNGTGVWSVTTLAKSASATLTLVYKVAANTAVGAIIKDTATVTLANESFTSNVASVSTTVSPLLKITSVVAPPTIFAGFPILYAITVTNTSKTTSTVALLRDVLPAGTSFIGAAIFINGQFNLNAGGFVGGVFTTNAQSLAPLQSFTLYIAVGTSVQTPVGTVITNQVSARISAAPGAFDVDTKTMTTTVVATPPMLRRYLPLGPQTIKGILGI